MRPFFALLLSAACVFAAVSQTNIQMLVPGFTVQELPLRLRNINNLRFAPDGRLFALGYNGKVYVLRDTDRDGVEDTAEVFWDKPTITVPVGMFIAPDGVLIASQGKVSMLSDTNSDGVADVEKILASGWPRTDVHSGGVDAAAITRDSTGNIYFGLLTADYSNPYRVKDGVSRYDVNGQRGTIQKLTPDGKLENFATGIRVPYTLAFNKRGDLFLTDQEGETWCPNGNPLDELNHIVPGKNYGFPPRHPEHLPNLISEAPAVAFGPQHQSACGLVFNEPTPHQGLFGPQWWEGDAFVSGESRGKIWRVRLVKTPHGYIGKEYLIASVNMLTPDLTISPRGELYITCHSGPPDWGTGPNGEGRLFKISYTETNAPQPVVAASSDVSTVEIRFDRPLKDSATNSWIGHSIEFGEFVRARDRYEVLRPPYQVVKNQLASPRHKLAITGAALSEDRRALLVRTDRQRETADHALALSGVAGGASATDVSVSFTRHGVMATFGSHHVWLPHLDLSASMEWLRGSATSGTITEWRSASAASESNNVKLETFIAFPAGNYVLHLEADAPFSVQTKESAIKGPARERQFSFDSDGTNTWGLHLWFDSLSTSRLPTLHASYTAAADPTRRVVPPHWLNVDGETKLPVRALPQVGANFLAKGDYENGRSLFFGERLKCASCHSIRGEGVTVGPDLSNLVSRDVESVLRDINDPSAAINPDHVAFNLTLTNDDEINGVVSAHDAATLQVASADGKHLLIPRATVREITPSSVSLMPTGLLEGLKESQINDLLHFLLNEPPRHTRADVEAVLKKVGAQQKTVTTSKPLNIVLVASQQDHGPGQHDYPACQSKWNALLSSATNLTVTNAWLWPTKEQFERADVVLFYYWNRDWNPQRYTELDDYLSRGGGVVLLHSSCIADKEPELLSERVGFSAQPQRTKYRHTALDLVPAGEHPIVRGLPTVRFVDETYWPLIESTNRVESLAVAEEEGKSWPMLWTSAKGKGRVFGNILGHYTWTHEDPLFRLIVLRGIAWAAGENPEALVPLLLQNQSPGR